MGTFQSTGTDSRIRTSDNPPTGTGYSVNFWVDLASTSSSRFLFLNQVCIIDMNPAGTVRFRDSGGTVFPTITGSMGTGLHMISLSIKSSRAEAFIDAVSVGSSTPTSIAGATGFHLNETVGTGFSDCQYGGANVWSKFVEPEEIETMFYTNYPTYTYRRAELKWDFNEGSSGSTISGGQIINIIDPSFNSLSQGSNVPEFGDNEMSLKYRRRRAS